MEVCQYRLLHGRNRQELRLYFALAVYASYSHIRQPDILPLPSYLLHCRCRNRPSRRRGSTLASSPSSCQAWRTTACWTPGGRVLPRSWRHGSRALNEQENGNDSAALIPG